MRITIKQILSFTILFIVCSCALIAFAKTKYSKPKHKLPCQIEPQTKKVLPKGNAGCLIHQDGKLVFVDEGSGYNSPGGTAKKKELAWQTACRETNEEVFGGDPNVTIKVGRLLGNLKGRFYVYECSVDKDKLSQVLEKGWGRDGEPTNPRKIKVRLFNPKKLAPKKWRFQNQKKDLVKMLKLIE